MQPLPLITGKNRMHYGQILKKIAELVDQGTIKPLIDDHQFTFHQISKAHAHLENGNAIGKVVVSLC
jgi:NADPH:quinone reductase